MCEQLSNVPLASCIDALDFQELAAAKRRVNLYSRPNSGVADFRFTRVQVTLKISAQVIRLKVLLPCKATLALHRVL